MPSPDWRLAESIMSDDFPEDELEESRAALAPTLEATAAILPWLDKPQPLRFEKQLNSRWIATCTRLSIAWAERHGHPDCDDLRSAIFGLYAIALETGDTDCLKFGEALASAADRLEHGEPAARLVAALSAAIECLTEENGLEHPLFPERVRHFAERIENALTVAYERSPVVDRLFVSEAREHLERMKEALAVLPPDAYALRLESSELAQQAEPLELFGIMHLARQLAAAIPTDGQPDIDDPQLHARIEAFLQQLDAALDGVLG